MTKKFDAFTTALRALCLEHGTQINAPHGLLVRNLQPGERPLYGWAVDLTNTTPGDPKSDDDTYTPRTYART